MVWHPSIALNEEARVGCKPLTSPFKNEHLSIQLKSKLSSEEYVSYADVSNIY